nr:hypothetical protein FFPRI1PSEUD_33880 [Pseudomonas sp. FFPRI_1]
MGIGLAHQEHLVAASGNGLADHFFGAALTVHLRGVDQGHAQVDTRAQRGDFLIPLLPTLTHSPCALANDRNLCVGELQHAHGYLLVGVEWRQ